MKRITVSQAVQTAYGVEAEHHEIVGVTLPLGEGAPVAHLQSWVSHEAREAGMQPLPGATRVELPGVDAVTRDGDDLSWIVEAEVVQRAAAAALRAGVQPDAGK